jgi:dienelactone hydrolase
MTIKLITQLLLISIPILFKVGCTPQDFDEVAHYKIGDDVPLVVLLGGSEGGYPHIPFLIEKFRSRGISVAEIAYFGLPNGPKYLQEINIDSVAAEIGELSQRHSCIGVLGISKGAELALLLAAYQPVSDATVAMVPSHVVWQSSRVAIRNTSSWAFQGTPLDFVPYNTLSVKALLAALDYEEALPLHMAALENAEAAQNAAIPVEDIDQPVLLQSALRDQIWPSVLMSLSIIERANQFNAEHRITHQQYDHDHYLLNSHEAVSDLLGFFYTAFEDC